MDPTEKPGRTAPPSDTPDDDAPPAYVEVQIFSRHCVPEEIRVQVPDDDSETGASAPGAADAVVSPEVAALGLEVFTRTDPSGPFRRAAAHGRPVGTDGPTDADDPRVRTVDLTISRGTSATGHITIDGSPRPLVLTLTPRRRSLPPSMSTAPGRVRLRGLCTVPAAVQHAQRPEGTLGITRTTLILTAGAAGIEIHPGRFSRDGVQSLDAAELQDVYFDWLSAVGNTSGSFQNLEFASRPRPHLFLTMGLAARLSGAEHGPPTFQPGWVEQEGAEPFVFDDTYAINTALLHYELTRRGIGTTRLNRLFITDDEGAHFSGHVTTTNRTATPAVRAVSRKSLTSRRLRSAGIEVARAQVFDHRSQLEGAWEFASQFPRAVVKPSGGTKGRGVTVGIEDRETFEIAWNLAFGLTSGEVLVEEHFEGTEARFLVVGGRCLAVSMRRPPRVVGDGKHTIHELIQRSNAERRRSPHLYNRLIALDSGRVQRMRRAGVGLLTVLGEGEVYTIDDKGGFSTGADSIDITDDVHPSFLEVAARAAATFTGLDVAGADILAHDLRQEAVPGNYIVVEINSQPGIGAHHFPVDGRARNVAGAIIEATLAPRSSQLTSGGASVAVPPVPEAWESHQRDPDTALLAEELTRRGFSVQWWLPEYIEAHRDLVRVSCWGSATNLTGHAGVLAASRPALASRLLKQAQVPVPRSRLFTRGDADTALAYAEELDHVVVRSGMAAGVAVSPAEEEQFAEAWSQARRTGRHGVVVEQHATGEEYWFLVAHGVVLHALQHTAAGPVGHRVSTFHPSYLVSAAAAAGAFLGLDLCEVALVLKDRKDPSAGSHVVRMVRPGPSLTAYHSPVSGARAGVVRDLVDLHLGTFRAHSDAFTAAQWQPRFRRVRRYLRPVRARLGRLRRRVRSAITRRAGQ